MRGDGIAARDGIEVDPRVMLGKPVVRGTRVGVELILRKLAEGTTEQGLLDAYPSLTVAGIRAALACGEDAIAHEDVELQEPLPRVSEG